MRSAICTARMDLPTLESANRQDSSPSYQKLSHSARGVGSSDASSMVRLAVLILITPILSGIPLRTWEALARSPCIMPIQFLSSSISFTSYVCWVCDGAMRIWTRSVPHRTVARDSSGRIPATCQVRHGRGNSVCRAWWQGCSRPTASCRACLWEYPDTLLLRLPTWGHGCPQPLHCSHCSAR